MAPAPVGAAPMKDKLQRSVNWQTQSAAAVSYGFEPHRCSKSGHTYPAFPRLNKGSGAGFGRGRMRLAHARAIAKPELTHINLWYLDNSTVGQGKNLGRKNISGAVDKGYFGL